MRARFALAVLGSFFVAAALAEQLSSDRPIAARVSGRTFLFPNLVDYPELARETNETLTRDQGGGRVDWVIAPLLPDGPNRTSLDEALSPPGGRHPLGTDELGRDVLSRLIHGSRVSLTVGVVAALVSALIGLLLGAAAGYFGGWMDAVVTRLIEVVSSVPTLFVILCVLGVTRVRSIVPVMAVIGLTRWTDVARLIRGEVLRIRELDYVQASSALGASEVRVLWTHVIPNSLGPVWVAATFGISGAILVESALSFLGFGVPPPASSWGALLTQAHRYVFYPGAWWLALFPGLAIFLTVLSVNLLAEGIRDALDPKLR